MKDGACCSARPSSPASIGLTWKPILPAKSAATRAPGGSLATTTCTRCPPTWKRSTKPCAARTPTRVLAGRFGAPFTYAAFNKERCFAPGMLTFDELSKVYNYGRIKSDTQVYGVVGDPIGHSLSPLLHNTAFRKLDINAVYVPFRVPRGELDRKSTRLNSSHVAISYAV